MRHCPAPACSHSLRFRPRARRKEENSPGVNKKQTSLQTVGGTRMMLGNIAKNATLSRCLAACGPREHTRNGRVQSVFVCGYYGCIYATLFTPTITDRATDPGAGGWLVGRRLSLGWRAKYTHSHTPPAISLVMFFFANHGLLFCCYCCKGLATTRQIPSDSARAHTHTHGFCLRLWSL